MKNFFFVLSIVFAISLIGLGFEPVDGESAYYGDKWDNFGIIMPEDLQLVNIGPMKKFEVDPEICFEFGGEPGCPEKSRIQMTVYKQWIPKGDTFQDFGCGASKTFYTDTFSSISNSRTDEYIEEHSVSWELSTTVAAETGLKAGIETKISVENSVTHAWTDTFTEITSTTVSTQNSQLKSESYTLGADESHMKRWMPFQQIGYAKYDIWWLYDSTRYETKVSVPDNYPSALGYVARGEIVDDQTQYYHHKSILQQIPTKGYVDSVLITRWNCSTGERPAGIPPEELGYLEDDSIHLKIWFSPSKNHFHIIVTDANNNVVEGAQVNISTYSYPIEEGAETCFKKGSSTETNELGEAYFYLPDEFAGVPEDREDYVEKVLRDCNDSEFQFESTATISVSKVNYIDNSGTIVFDGDYRNSIGERKWHFVPSETVLELSIQQEEVIETEFYLAASEGGQYLEGITREDIDFGNVVEPFIPPELPDDPLQEPQPGSPPIIKTPQEITVLATSESGTIVEYMEQIIVEDDKDENLVPSCDPSSGSEFQVGETEVTCTVQDTDENITTESFMVKVEGSDVPEIPKGDSFSLSSSLDDNSYMIVGNAKTAMPLAFTINPHE